MAVSMLINLEISFPSLCFQKEHNSQDLEEES